MANLYISIVFEIESYSSSSALLFNNPDFFSSYFQFTSFLAHPLVQLSLSGLFLQSAMEAATCNSQLNKI